jgi:IS5 family transposase
MGISLRDYPFSVKRMRRNLGISRIILTVEHPYAFCKGMFYFGHVIVTTVQRVKVKTYFTIVCNNLVRAGFIDRRV